LSRRSSFAVAAVGNARREDSMGRASDLFLAALRIGGLVTTDYETSERVLAVVTTDQGLQKSAEELLDSTMELIESGASARDAVAALQELNPNPKEADLALGLLRLFYFPFELSDANAAWRYLVAIKHGADVDPPTAEDSVRIGQIEPLAQLDEPEQAFELLKSLEPKLGDVETQVIGECSQWDGSDHHHDGFLRIDGLLEPIIGPDSNQPDAVLSSRYAFHIVRRHLIKVADLLA
jgi:hypothetical protein